MHLTVEVYLPSQVSMYNDEIFIIGKPPILLHSKDAGKSWERVPLSPKVRALTTDRYKYANDLWVPLRRRGIIWHAVRPCSTTGKDHVSGPEAMRC